MTACASRGGAPGRAARACARRPGGATVALLPLPSSLRPLSLSKRCLAMDHARPRAGRSKLVSRIISVRTSRIIGVRVLTPLLFFSSLGSYFPNFSFTLRVEQWGSAQRAEAPAGAAARHVAVLRLGAGGGAADRAPIPAHERARGRRPSPRPRDPPTRRGSRPDGPD